MEYNWLKKWFLFCSGAHLDILLEDDCKSEHNKYIGIGTAVFFTGFFAFISSTYALFTIFKFYPLAIIIGLIWGSFIFSLDRYIVSTLKKEKGSNRFSNILTELLVASPRIILAIFLAIIISKPLELKIFEREIESKLISMQQGIFKTQEQQVRDRFQPSINSRNSEISTLQRQVDVEKNKYDNLRTSANSEADGLGGSQKRGVGKIFRIKDEAARKQESTWQDVLAQNAPLISDLRSKNKIEKEKLKVGLEGLKRVSFDGLLARISALGKLSDKDASTYWASLAIMFLFVMIELVPLIFKIFTERGIYDIKIQMLEERVHSEEIEKISNLNDEVNKRIKIKVEENQNLIERELKDNKKLMNKISKAQLSLAQEIIDTWHTKQMDKIRDNPAEYIGGLRNEEKNKQNRS